MVFEKPCRIVFEILIVGLVLSCGARHHPPSTNPWGTTYATLKNPAKGQNTSHYDGSDDDIIFPDSFDVYQTLVTPLSFPPNCAGGRTFCENIESYPHGHVKKVLQRTWEHRELFGVDETPEEMVNRIDDHAETFVCPFDDKMIYPKVGKTKKNEWKFIVNQGDSDGYVQGVRVEVCKELKRPCNIIGGLTRGIATMCKQKYVYRRMVSISPRGRPEVDTFLMPSACCCAFTRHLHFSPRQIFSSAKKPRR